MKEHYVYYFYEDDYEWGPLKVGRSKKPWGRLNCFENEHGFRPRMLVTGPFELQDAQALERKEIVRCSPPYNKYVASSAGNLGLPMQEHVRRAMSVSRPCTLATRVKISNAHLGYKFSAEARAKMSASARKRPPNPEARAKAAKSNIGRRRTPEQCARISASRVGKPLSEAHRKALCVASAKRLDRQHLLHSGYGYPWRLATLDEATRRQVEAL